jgi:hypothetical protein
MDYQKYKIPEQYLEKWQQTVNLLPKTFLVPAGLIMQVWPEQIKVLVLSQTGGHPERNKTQNLLKGWESMMDSLSAFRYRAGFSPVMNWR